MGGVSLSDAAREVLETVPVAMRDLLESGTAWSEDDTADLRTLCKRLEGLVVADDERRLRLRETPVEETRERRLEGALRKLLDVLGGFADPGVWRSPEPGRWEVTCYGDGLFEALRSAVEAGRSEVLR